MAIIKTLKKVISFLAHSIQILFIWLIFNKNNIYKIKPHKIKNIKSQNGGRATDRRSSDWPFNRPNPTEKYHSFWSKNCATGRFGSFASFKSFQWLKAPLLCNRNPCRPAFASPSFLFVFFFSSFLLTDPQRRHDRRIKRNRHENNSS